MKKAAIALLVVVLVIGGGAFVAWQAFSRGIAGFDDWIVRKVVGIAELYLVPDVEFDSFDYDSGAVTLQGVRLIAPDGTDVVDAGSLRVTLASIPVPGGGVVIERVEISDAELHLIRAESPEGEVQFRGLVPFVEREKVEQQDQVEEDMQLRNAFAIRLIKLDNCSITYEPGGDEPPMSIAGIAAELDVQPREDDGQADGGLGTYDLALNIDRSPLFSISMRGDANLDDITLHLAKLTLRTDLEHKEAVDILPGRLQTLIADHDVRGTLDVEASGTILGTAPLDSTLNARVGLEHLNVATGNYRFPIESGTIDVELEERVAEFPKLTIQSCGGTISADNARLRIQDQIVADVGWRIEGFQMRELLRTHTDEEGKAPELAGIVSSSGSAGATLDDLPDSISGSGELQVRDGRLVNLPLQRELAAALGVLDLITRREPKLNDRGDVAFRLTGEGVEVTKATVQTSVLAARGDGMIYYDRRLDLLVNAGPLEKIQEKTGPIGDILGMITDKLVKYDVEGTIGKPKVSVRPLGIGG